MIASFHDPVDNVTALVDRHVAGYLVRLRDDDSGLMVNSARICPTRDAAIAYARSLVTAPDVINPAGLEHIRAWLADRMINGGNLGAAEIAAWARDAEYQVSEGNPPSIELRASQSVSGHTETFTVPADGIGEAA